MGGCREVGLDFTLGGELLAESNSVLGDPSLTGLISGLGICCGEADLLCDF